MRAYSPWFYLVMPVMVACASVTAAWMVASLDDASSPSLDAQCITAFEAFARHMQHIKASADGNEIHVENGRVQLKNANGNEIHVENGRVQLKNAAKAEDPAPRQTELHATPVEGGKALPAAQVIDTSDRNGPRWRVTGEYRDTLKDARASALALAQRAVYYHLRNQIPPPDWQPPPSFSAERLVKETKAENKDFGGILGVMYRVTVDARSSAEAARAIAEQERKARAEDRMLWLGKILAVLITLLTVVAGYLQLVNRRPVATSRFYWSLRSIPELADLPRAERGRLWRRCLRRSLRHWQTWSALLVCGLCAGLGGLVGEWVGVEVGARTIGGMLGAAIGGGIGGFLFQREAMPLIRSYLRAERETVHPRSGSDA